MSKPKAAPVGTRTGTGKRPKVVENKDYADLMSGLPPVNRKQRREQMRNCAECGQAREGRVLNEHGVCPRCLMPVLESRPNPCVPENTSAPTPPENTRYSVEGLLTLRSGWYPS